MARIVGLVLGIVVPGIVVAACSGSSGSGASCSTADPCPKDPPPTAQDISECQQLENKCSGFAAYYDCAFAQIKCTTAGTLDDQATQQAIAANCQTQAQGVRGCVISSGGFDGGSGFDSAPLCGFSGEACCATGTPCQGGCCDTSSHCVATDEQCAGGASVCMGSGACQPCGAPGQACCPGDSCASGGCCDLSASPTTCVASGSSCAPVGSNATMCTGSFCELCGSDAEPCCPGRACPGSTSTLPLYCTTTATCAPCGGIGEPCCPSGAQCTSGTCNGTTCQ